MVCQRKDSEWEQHNIRMRRRIAQQARSMRARRGVPRERCSGEISQWLSPMASERPRSNGSPMSNPAVAARSGTPDYHAGMPTEAGAPDRDSIPKGSTRVVYAALARNVANAAAKFVAYGLSAFELHAHRSDSFARRLVTHLPITPESTSDVVRRDLRRVIALSLGSTGAHRYDLC